MQYVSTNELAKQANVDQSTIKYYSDQGLLLYIKNGLSSSKAEKRYPLKKNLHLIQRIKSLKEDGYNISMIKEALLLDPFWGRKREQNKLEKLIINKSKEYLPKLEIEFLKCIARESYIDIYWSGKKMEKDILINCHIKTNEGNIEFTEFMNRNVKTDIAIWQILYTIGSRLGLSVFDSKYTHIYDKELRKELSKFDKRIIEFID